MDYSVLEKSSLFSKVPAAELREILEGTPHYIQCYEKDETIFRLMEPALRIGIILEGRVEAHKFFLDGSQVNVSTRIPGETIGSAAVFSKNRKYPCDMVALEPVTVMMFRREDLLGLLQKNVQILENFTTEIGTATYMLQQQLELLSYNGIAKKAAFWLLMQVKESGKDKVCIPGSVSKWAMLMNVSRTSLHRELKRLEEAGILSYAPPMISILDMGALEELFS